MTEKRYNVWDIDGTIFLEDHKEGSYHIGQVGNVDINCLNDIANRLNDLTEENEKLKRSGASLGVKNDGLILENYELRNEITKLCEFLTSKGYDNDDFMEWIVTQFNKKTDLKEFSE